ncbi:NAD(P)-dependent oxidoreductase [Candidatus Saccharibacteria bacterium]|nr:NAD(P)-dependent oxidoreductase [Candidatus Saccharibacteria bacterium]
MDDSKFLITGAHGQLGTALQVQYPNAQATDSNDLNIADWQTVKNFDWGNITTVLNAAGYTNVDGAESYEGRIAAWGVNSQAVANLARIAQQKDLLVVHISTDYVFDGIQKLHKEDEPLSPLSTYGASKAAGDVALSVWAKHYLLRTSWVIGEGKNFVRTMLELGQKAVNPTVVSDQVGRPTFTSELARVIDHLFKNQPAFGTYNVSNGGQAVSWADLTRAIFEDAGLDNTVTDTTTAEYYKDKPQAAARPLISLFDLTKIESTGFEPTDWRDDLKEYVKKELNQ